MGARKHDEVMEFVRQRILGSEEPPTVKDLYAEAQAEVDSSVGEMSLREFNATYPLQIRRKLYQRKKERAEEVRKQLEGVEMSGNEVEKPERPPLESKSGHELEATPVVPTDGILADIRSPLRQTLIMYAQEVAKAETKHEILEVVGDHTEDYIDTIMDMISERVVEAITSG